MRVLQIISNLGAGGAEKLVEQFVPIMNEKENLHVDILLLTDKGNVFEKSLKERGDAYLPFLCGNLAIR